ncbi:MAG: alpha/beta hydrolase [Gilvibacter sp.]
MKILKTVIALCLVLTSINTSAQDCPDDDRFTNAEYFKSTQIDSIINAKYGNSVNFAGESQDLFMDFYFPKNDEDSMQKRPFILLIHGGGFKRGTKELMAYECKEFARRGFVTATMSYRLGFDTQNMADAANAVYRAQQDANNALRYMITQAEALNIDTSLVFLGGTSAGAITSNFVALANQEEWNKVLPPIEGNLGPLEAVNDITIQGVFNNVGSIMPFALWEGEMVPTISFHGDNDMTVPIDNSLMTGFGSREMHKRLTQAGVCNDFTLVPGGTHGIYMDKAGFNFKINRVACFFRSLMCDTCVDFLAEETVPASCTD